MQACTPLPSLTVKEDATYLPLISFVDEAAGRSSDRLGCFRRLQVSLKEPVAYGLHPAGENVQTFPCDRIRRGPNNHLVALGPDGNDDREKLVGPLKANQGLAVPGQLIGWAKVLAGHLEDKVARAEGREELVWIGAVLPVGTRAVPGDQRVGGTKLGIDFRQPDLASGRRHRIAAVVVEPPQSGCRRVERLAYGSHGQLDQESPPNRPSRNRALRPWCEDHPLAAQGRTEPLLDLPLHSREPAIVARAADSTPQHEGEPCVGSESVSRLADGKMRRTRGKQGFTDPAGVNVLIRERALGTAEDAGHQLRVSPRGRRDRVVGQPKTSVPRHYQRKVD